MKGLEFKHNFGNVEFKYKEPSRDGGGYHEISDEIPQDVVEKGQEAIIDYAKNEVHQAKKKWEKAYSVRDEIRKNHIHIKTEYEDGTSLEGRIVEATGRIVRVELDKPIKGESSINFGFASGMAGQYVFTEEHEISKHGYDAAYRALRTAYKNTLNKPTQDLVDNLNESLK